MLILKAVPISPSVANPTTEDSVASLAVKPPSSSQELNSDCEPGNGLNSNSETNSSPQIALPENQLVPAIPVRSSSNSNSASSTSPPKSGQATIVQTETSHPEFQLNSRPESRSGSIASSKQSRKAAGTPPTVSNNNTNIANIPSPPSNEKEKQLKKRGVSRFLHFLNCCSSSDNATVDSHTQPVSPRPKGLPHMRGRQPTLVVNPTPSAADSSTGESKEATDENIGGPAYLEHTPALKPTMHNPRSNETLSSEKTDYTEKTAKTEHTEFSEKTDKTVQETTANSLAEKEDLAESGSRNQPLPPLQAAKSPTAYTEESGQTKSGIPVPYSIPEVADPSRTPLTTEKIVDKDMAKDHNQSPEQENRAGDVVMTDAPPIAPGVERGSNTENRDETPAHVNLPPPPPRDGPGRAGGIGRTPSNAAAPNDKQQYLLPPLQPRFKGKKCLVLDLDETLVHSSFKVCFKDSLVDGFHEPTLSRYFTRPILRYP